MPEIPEHWVFKRGKALFHERSMKGYPDEPLLAASQKQGVVLKEMLEQRSMEAIQNFESFKLVEKDDFVISLRSFEGGIELAYFRGIISPVYSVFCFRENTQNRDFYKYLFKSRMFIQELNVYKKGIRDGQSINFSEFANIYLPVPPLHEQDQIVLYIKAQEEKINRFIDKKQGFIELLKEQKDLIAFSAIHMDGIKNGCPERRIKSFSQILRGKFTHRPRNDERLYDGEYPFIQTGEVSQANKYINGYRQTLNDWGYSVSKEFPKGTLCLTIAANVGDVAILNFNACFPDSIVGIVPNDEVDLDFLYHALKSLKAKFLSEATLTTQYNLNVERIGPIKIPIPNLETQKKIVIELETETATIDTAIAKAEREIELIREYKEAMISEAVIGKIL
ncbi:MAG: hypothetical protein A2265_03850 [Bacteroidetes bacterium RIFOXYA12_FULL_33_9]|nr:MAG: hypothetical protein A2265_03850 [Bacteroidetes bacterium RIFOXYA12_FULL_33_9]